MILKLYQRAEKTGWLGWIETCKGDAAGFVKLDGSIVFEW